jgi:hypothetical protein
LEAGSFWSALRRKRVLFVRKAGVEIPTDFNIVYAKYQDLPSKEAGTEIKKFIERIRGY